MFFNGTNVPIPIETKGIGTITIEIGKRENWNINSNSRFNNVVFFQFNRVYFQFHENIKPDNTLISY